MKKWSFFRNRDHYDNMFNSKLEDEKYPKINLSFNIILIYSIFKAKHIREKTTIIDFIKIVCEQIQNGPFIKKKTKTSIHKKGNM